jgi:hypothetical protein
MPAAGQVIDFTCPFCGGRCSVMIPPAVTHTLPACARFLELEVTDFLAAVNRDNAKRN